MTITPAQDKAIRSWQQLKANAVVAVAAELGARKAMLALCYPEHKPGAELEGNHNIELGNGYKLKGVFGTNYKVNAEALPGVLIDLTAAGASGDHASNTLFKYTPELSVTAYKLLMPTVKAIADGCITTKPASPQFEIIEPKAKAK